jgi:hypothetical protein
MYQKPVIDHCPWPSSQFNKWHAQNKLLSSSLISYCHREQPLVHSPLTPANHCRRKACFFFFTGVSAASNSAYHGCPEMWILRYPAHRYHAVPSPGCEPTTIWLRVRHPNHSATSLHTLLCTELQLRRVPVFSHTEGLEPDDSSGLYTNLVHWSIDVTSIPTDDNPPSDNYKRITRSVVNVIYSYRHIVILLQLPA